MGLLVDGRWREDRDDTRGVGGEFVRPESAFRGFVTADGTSRFAAEPGRYHLYVSLACPWAHRTLIFRRLKRLDSVIGLSVVDPVLGSEGWRFSDAPGAIPDTVNGFTHLHQLYTRALPDYTGRVTVPVLWDKSRATIVNNESAEIIRMFNGAFDAFPDSRLDFYPAALRDEIDALNARIYADVNNGVYRVGFATTQAAYERAFDRLFAALDELEERLSRRRYLVGERITEADWRLFTTLVRFDAVYHGHFKCNRRRLVDYPNLWAYTRELYQVPGVAETVDMDHIKHHYYASHRRLNPIGIVPKGPEIDFLAPHRRDGVGRGRHN
ncbi:MAG: glutathione S-transferase family protein [Proteobacteria bacterium]|nr:glutathione S-transferase family protein [Pseudomonadota bacterium]